MKKTKAKKITLQKDIVQKGDIKVAAQIINDLSSGIYSSPASCVKELINNSYDADAKLVTIRIKPIEDSITVIDDGKGMNAIDFDENFAWISKSNKRNKGEKSDKGRPLIGKIGIGFIAVNEICEALEITSTKKGEDVKFVATINFKDFEKRKVEVAEGGQIKAAYQLTNTAEDKDSHYTIIRLLGIRPGVRQILDNGTYVSTIENKHSKGVVFNHFKSMRDMLEFHHKKSLNSFSEDETYIQFAINLASYVPVEYVEGGPIEGVKDKLINEIVQMHKKFDFKVDLDGIYLKKPIYFPKQESSTYKSFSETIKTSEGEIKFKGYFYAQNKLLRPREMNGIAIRVKNIPIAIRYGFDTTFMDYPNYTNQIFQNWISGEIYVEKGLEDAMNIDRQSFRETHPHYRALQDFVHKFLQEEFFPKYVFPLYKTGKDQRDKAKKDGEKHVLKTISDTKKVKFDVAKSTSTTKERPVSIKTKNTEETLIEIDDSFRKKIKAKDWEYLKNVFLIFEIAFKESNKDMNKFHKLFYEKITRWIEEK